MLFPATTGGTVRRFHDLNASNWIFLVWIILFAILVVGFFTWIAFLFWFCFQGTEGENKYGADPLCADTHYNESKAREERQRRENEERARREAEREKVRQDQDAGRERGYTRGAAEQMTSMRYYEILGVTRNMSLGEITRAYLKLIKQYAPDMVEHLGEEFKKLAHEKLSRLISAWERIKKEKS